MSQDEKEKLKKSVLDSLEKNKLVYQMLHDL